MNFFPPGGMWTNFLRPIQNTTVATAMRMPGMAKATLDP